MLICFKKKLSIAIALSMPIGDVLFAFYFEGIINNDGKSSNQMSIKKKLNVLMHWINNSTHENA
jgi:hypothetical protein